MDPPKPKSPSSMAHEPGGTPPTHLTHLGDDDTAKSSSSVGPSVEPELTPPYYGVSSTAVSGGQRRASLADNVVRSPPSFNTSVEVTHVQAAPSQTVMTTASDAPSTTVPDGHRRAPLADDANKLFATVDRDAFVELVHNRDVLANSNVRSEAASNFGGSLANASITDAPVELARNQAAPLESMAGPARRGSAVESERSVPRRASVQDVDDVSASSSLANSLVGPPHIQTVPSIESSINLRSADDVVRQCRASAATDASLLSSPLDSFTDTSDNQAVPSGMWPTDLGPSSHSAAAHHVLVTDDTAPSTGRSGHVAQVEQSDDVSSEHVKGSDPPSSVSRRASHEALVTIGQPISTIAEAAASLDSLYTNRRPPSPSSDHLSMNDHNASHSSISHEPAVPEHRSVVAATSPSDASLRHDVGAAASRLTEAAALLTEAAALLSKASGTSSWPLHEQPHETEAPNAFAPAPSTDVQGAALTRDYLDADVAAHNSVGQGPLDVQNPSQVQGTPEVKPDPALVAALTTAMGEPTGWAAIEKAMTNYDREEIGGYKEDIDSLLTFTGLYSAVLTAFVIVSYPLLQDQDPSSGSTSTLSSSPFQPPISAIRINILWFASLVISLATASFAILVKQWLRAYMAFATASPQGQLRVRHFRRSGLTAWRVFGIASTLPLLLQISLALFFAGLCIFTWDVHPTLAKTTLPLVATWAFLFLAVTITPSFTARCPYTTPALAGITTFLRTHLYTSVVVVVMKHIPYRISWVLYNVFDWITDYDCASFLTPTYRLFRYATYYLEKYETPKPVEEVNVQKDVQHDLEILATADALQADDRLLGTTIKSALEQSDANWVQLIEFAMQIIGNRIPVVDGETNLEHIFSAYRSLSPHVRSVIDEIFQSHIISQVANTLNDGVTLANNWQWQTIVRWACCIITQLNYTPNFSQPLNTSSEQISTVMSRSDGNIWQGFKSALILCRMSYVALHNVASSKDNFDFEKQFVRQCLTFQYATVCQAFETMYTDAEDMHQLSNVIHSIVDYDNRDFKNLKAIEILKLSLLSVRVMYGKVHDNQDSRPRWSSIEAAQWKRTFIWLAFRLWEFWPYYHLSHDEQATLQQLARTGWGEILDQTEDSSQEALPLPDYFYFMLWRTAGGDLSQIPSQHPQLLQIAQMSWDERDDILNKGMEMARAYQRNPGNLYPPRTVDNDGEALGGVQTSAPLQVVQDSILIDSAADAEELGVAGVLQQELSTDTSDASPSESRAPSEAGLRATGAAEQHSQTDSGPAGSIQPGQALSPVHETSQDSEHTGPIQSERVDGRDDPKELQPEGTPMELPEEVEDLAGTAAHPTSVEDKFASSLSEGCPTPVSLPTSARNETVPAEAQEGSEVTTDHARAYPISDHAASLLGDGAAAEDDLQHADNIAAGNLHTIQGTRDEVYTHADVEAGTGSEEKMAEAGPRPGE